MCPFEKGSNRERLGNYGSHRRCHHGQKNQFLACGRGARAKGENFEVVALARARKPM